MRKDGWQLRARETAADGVREHRDGGRPESGQPRRFMGEVPPGQTVQDEGLPAHTGSRKTTSRLACTPAWPVSGRALSR